MAVDVAARPAGGGGMIGGPCDALALEVGSRLMRALEITTLCPVRVAVTWEAEPFRAYAYRVERGDQRALQFVTDTLLEYAISPAMVTALLAARVGEQFASGT